MSTRPYARILSVTDLMATADRLGSHFFSLDTMRHFNSRVSRAIRIAESDATRERQNRYADPEPEEIRILFLTSERDVRSAWNGHRRYTLRTAHVRPGLNGNAGKDLIQFDTVGEFGAHRSLSQAKRALKALPFGEWNNEDLFREVR